jgi:hypothetical protein
MPPQDRFDAKGPLPETHLVDADNAMLSALCQSSNDGVMLLGPTPKDDQWQAQSGRAKMPSYVRCQAGEGLGKRG